MRPARAAGVIALAALGYALVLAWLIGAPLPLDQVVIGHWDPQAGTDLDGTLWFWTWTEQAFVNGLDPLCPVDTCAPEGQCLGRQYLNRGDALFAVPFGLMLEFPTSYNVAVLAMLWLSGLAGMGLLRVAGAHPVIAWLGGLWLGLGPFSMTEIAAGRPSSGVLLFPLLALGAAVLATRGGPRRALAWVVVAGACGAMSVVWYLPWALPMAVVAPLLAASQIPQVGWRRAVAVLAGVVVASGLFATPYLLEVQDRRASEVAQALSMTSSAEGVRRLVSDVGRASLPYDFFWNPGASHQYGPLSVSILGLVLLGVALVGVRRSWPVLLATLATGLLTLGPVLLLDAAPVVAKQPLVYLPTIWLMHAFPALELAFRPYRVFPFVLVAAWLTIAVGLPWRRLRPAPGAARVAVWVALAVLGTVDYWAYGRAVQPRLTPQGAQTPQVFVELAEDPRPGAILDVPLGSGIDSAAWYAVHKRPRASVAEATFTERAPGCASDPLVRSLWRLGVPGVTADPSRLVAGTFRWVAVHPGANQAHPDWDPELARAELEASLGPPRFESATVWLWELPEAEAP